MSERDDWEARTPEQGHPKFQGTSPELGDNAASDTEDDENAAMANLSAVQADDAMLDALGGSDPKVADALGGQELNALLLAWRRDIDSEPIAELVDTDTAVTTVRTAELAGRRGSRGRKRRMLVPVAAAAAVLAITFTGTGLAARDAQPGDTLWGLSKVLYEDHTQSVEAAAAANVDLDNAKLALAQGRLAEAQQALDAAKAALQRVAAEDDLRQLEQRHFELTAKLRQPQSPGQQPPPNDPQAPDGPLPGPPSHASSSADTRPTDQPASPTELPDTTSSPPESTTSTSPPPSSSSSSGTDDRPGELPGSSPRFGTSQSEPATG